MFYIFLGGNTIDRNFKIIITFFKMENVFKHYKKIMISKGGLHAIGFVWCFIGILCLSKTTYLHCII